MRRERQDVRAMEMSAEATSGGRERHSLSVVTIKEDWELFMEGAGMGKRRRGAGGSSWVMAGVGQ